MLHSLVKYHKIKIRAPAPKITPPILQIKVNEKFCFRVPSYCRSLTVWHSAVAKEGKAYEDSTDVV